LSVVHEILGIRAPPDVFGGRADSHHSLRHDGTIAERCKETVYKTRVAIVLLEWAERVALGLSTRIRTGQPRLGPGHDGNLANPAARPRDFAGTARAHAMTAGADPGPSS
jgi:hypothetical protein